MHICKLSDILTADEMQDLQEVGEAALGELDEVLEQLTKDDPPRASEQTTAEAAEDYLALLSSTQRKKDAVVRFLSLLERG